uniref:Uncharacterized protein n=1 Tax=Cacopsylla melanoneura TaxID=428564 RepID=A0A8D8WGK9_9HEMI
MRSEHINLIQPGNASNITWGNTWTNGHPFRRFRNFSQESQGSKNDRYDFACFHIPHSLYFYVFLLLFSSHSVKNKLRTQFHSFVSTANYYLLVLPNLPNSFIIQREILLEI